MERMPDDLGFYILVSILGTFFAVLSVGIADEWKPVMWVARLSDQGNTKHR